MKILFPLSIAFFLVFLQIIPAEGSSADHSVIVEEFCEEEIYRTFSEIDAMASYISEHDIQYDDLEYSGFSNILLVNSSNIPGPIEGFFFDRQSAFFMGCVFGTLGILAVAIINEGNRDVLNSALSGCAASGSCVALSVVAVYVLYFLVIIGYM